MSLNEEVGALRRIPLFEKVDAAQLKLLAFTSERLTFPDGRELFHQGDLSDAAYIILDGAADILVDSDDGQIPVARLQKHEIVGEIGILIDVPRTATVRVTEEMTALAITKDSFFRMMREFPDMAIEIMRALARRLEATTGQLLKAQSANQGNG